MNYLQKFIYSVAENHFNEMEKASLKPKCMSDIFKEEVDRGLIQATLEYTGFHIASCAEVLGMSVSTLKSKLKKYDIHVLNV